METCKTCSWWIARTCERIELSNSKPKDKEAEIFADSADDHGLNAKLVTGPDFGCILHENIK